MVARLTKEQLNYFENPDFYQDYMEMFIFRLTFSNMSIERDLGEIADSKNAIRLRDNYRAFQKLLTMFFVLAVFLFGGATVASAIQQDDLLPPIGFSIFFIVSLIGSLNMIMWKLEVNGDEITWRSTFGRKRTFHFEDITYCERKKGSMRVYVNGEKLFTIDSNIY